MNAVGLNPEEVGGGVGQVVMGPPEMEQCEPLSIVVQRDGDTAVCVSRWEPTAEERARIAAGADILLYVWGWQVPVALSTLATEARG